MSMWIKNNWQHKNFYYCQVLFHKASGAAIMIFFARARFAILKKDDAEKFNNLLAGSNSTQMLEGFLLMNGDGKIAI